MNNKHRQPPRPEPKADPLDKGNNDFTNSSQTNKNIKEESELNLESEENERSIFDNFDVDTLFDETFSKEDEKEDNFEVMVNTSEEDENENFQNDEEKFSKPTTTYYTQEEPIDIQPDIEDLSPPADIEYTYEPNRSYFFIFGPKSAGKTVIISSIYDYLSTYRSADFGDTLENLNRNHILYEKRGNELLNQFTERSEKNEFLDGSSMIGSIGDTTRIPKHLNFRFEPASNKPDFELCFMDMAGEDLESIDYNSNRTLPPSIKTYVEDLPKENLCFIYVLDPLNEGPKSDKIQQIQLFNAFINLMDQNGHRETPVLLLVTKWDAVSGYKDVETYLKSEYKKIWGTIQQAGRNFTFAEFSIGDVDLHAKKIIAYNPTYPERVFGWMYKQQMGVDLNEPERKSGGFWAWLKKYF